MTWNWLLNILSGVFGQLVAVITPELRELIKQFVLDLWAKAVATDNVWDDFFVKLLAGLLGITLNDAE